MVSIELHVTIVLYSILFAYNGLKNKLKTYYNM